MRNVFEKTSINDEENKQHLGSYREISKDRYEQTCYAKLKTIEMHNGSKVEFLGVSHTKNTLKEFENEIREFVKDSEILVSEMANFELNEKQFFEIEDFYKAITQIAKEEKKKMIVPDPEKKFSDALVNTAISIAPCLVSFGSGAYLERKLYRMMAELNMRRFRKKCNDEYNVQDVISEKKKLMSRRDFLKTMAAAGIVAAGGMSTVAGVFEQMGVQKEKGKLLEKFLLDSLDYRDALVAREILKLSEENKKISVIYGAKHFPGIKELLGDRNLLAEKLSRYEKTYGIINDENPEVYDFNT
jgi:hypothetical protein